MNREQRRHPSKISLDDRIKSAVESLQKKEKNSIIIPEGIKVKLNIDRIKKDVNYPRLTDKYKIWVDNHADEVFTVEYDEKHQENPTLVCFKEDTSKPKWLFWTGDLTILVEDIKG